MKNFQLYPFKFYPILKEKVWGGSKLKELFSKASGTFIGESWELSGVPGDISVVSNGPLKGKTLSELIDTYSYQILGERIAIKFGDKFPLLFKFIDANQDLSIQLHPDDSLAKKRHDSFGKTEMWYIMQAEEEARLIMGFNRKMDEATYKKALSENRITEILNSVPVKAGDSFFIPPGTVHAIGAGVVLAEIQQTSDITYRIYDWDRPGTDGKMRELHNELALDAIDYNASDAKINYKESPNEAVLLKHTPFFTTKKLSLSADMDRDVSSLDSFVVYMCVDGEGEVTVGNISEVLKKGETVLIPAAAKEIKIRTQSATFLEVYIA
ncbi:type I phosphomannose isomerase catalytic subunit [Jejudonia soesokkakensis]|uniref:Phosphohexomutase n=1 Tax=Jejudonia soesokkakensis TaxID=1323432 RepID=A0ABW2MUE9_9FLAO